MEYHTIIALGSNLGDRAANLQTAIQKMHPVVRVTQASPIYQTPPWGITDQPWFLNQVVRGTTLLPPLNLLTFLKDLELKIGRQPAARFGPRLIDLDILFYDDLVLESKSLTIPHPELHKRAFVLVPLLDVAPDWIHPVIGQRTAELLEQVDSREIEPYKPLAEDG